MGFGSEDVPGTTDDNEPPEATLKTTPDTAWNGDTITFDGRNSTDEDGQVETWIFDLGDGNQKQAEKERNARFEYAYEEGGVYDVSLTVLDNGGNETGTESDTTSQQVVVNQRITVPPQTTFAGPAEDNNASTYNQEFPVNQHADRFETNLTLQSQLPAGSSEVKISVFDPADETIEQRTVTLNASENQTVELTGPLSEDGRHTLQVQTQSGSVAFEGELKVFYEEPTETEVDT